MEMALLRPRGAAFVTLVIDAIHGMVAAPHDIDRALSRLDFGLTHALMSPVRLRVNRP